MTTIASVQAARPSTPTLQMRQIYAKLGIDADLGETSILQPRATLEIQSEPAALSIEQPQGELIIDQSKAWDALAIGGHLEMMTRMREQGREIVQETIRSIAQRGDRLAMIHLNQDPIPEFAEQIRLQYFVHTFAGPASVDNVDIHYQAHKPRIDARQGELDIDVQPNPVQYEYHRGKLSIYMEQYPHLEIIPPQIDAFI